MATGLKRLLASNITLPTLYNSNYSSDLQMYEYSEHAAFSSQLDGVHMPRHDKLANLGSSQLAFSTRILWISDQ